MFRLYSKGCAYVLKALASIPANQVDQTFTAAWICAQAEVYESFTRKALQSLSQAGFLKTVTGPKGGYQFVKHPKTISLLEIVKTIEGENAFDACAMGLEQCCDDNPCPLHDTWVKMKNQILKALEKQTLFQLMSIQSQQR